MSRAAGPVAALGPFALVALLYVGTVRVGALGHPRPEMAKAGLPSLLLAHLIAYLATVVGGYIALMPYSRLGRSIYAHGSKRSMREYLALAGIATSQALVIAIQHSTYAETLRTFAFFRTPSWVLGVFISLPVWYIVRMKTSSVFRMTQVFFYLQVLLLPLLFLPLREWDSSNLIGLMTRPNAMVLSALPSVLHLYFGVPALLLLDNQASVKVARRVIPASVALVSAILVLATIFVSGVLGRELLAIEAYPGMKYYQTTRLPTIERLDLIILFTYSSVAISTSAVLGHGIMLALGTFGLGREMGAVGVGVLTAGSVFIRMIPGFTQNFFVASASLFVLGNILLLMIPKARQPA